MVEMPSLQKELLEVKKFHVEVCKERKVDENLAEIASFLAGLDEKNERLSKEEARLKEELEQLKSKKFELRKKLISQDDESKSLQVDLEYLKKENTNLGNQVASYEEKIKKAKTYQVATSDMEIIQRTVDKLNIFRRLTGVKFGPIDGDTVEGCVYNEKKVYLKHFQLKKDTKCDPELWRMIKEASHANWTSLENHIKEELNKKCQK